MMSQGFKTFSLSLRMLLGMNHLLDFSLGDFCCPLSGGATGNVVVVEEVASLCSFAILGEVDEGCKGGKGGIGGAEEEEFKEVEF